MAVELIIGAAALLLLLGGKKKKKKSGTSNGSGGGGTDDGGDLVGPDGNKSGGGGSGGGGGGGGGSGGSGGAPSNLANDAIWVSNDCKEVVYGDDTGEAFWESKGLKVAQNFIDANYHDPYEVAKTMVLSMAPCAIEFPVMEDGLSPMEEELRREFFNREFKDVYYLIQFLHDKVAALMDKEEYTIEFDDRCEVTFVGENWPRPMAERMIRFYLEYTYPTESGKAHDKKYPTWPMADIDENTMQWQDNVITAVINRMHPECGAAIVQAFKKDPWSATAFFNSRPGLKALYNELHQLVDWVDEHREGGLDFGMVDDVTG